MKDINMTNRIFKASVVQTLAFLGDLDANIALLHEYTEEAVRQGAKLVVFPECMNTGYLFDSEKHCAEIAESINGKFVQAMAGLCRKHDLHIASGFTEKASDGRIFNSGLLLDPSGSIICHYHKQFLATHDQNWFELGERGCPVVDTALGRIGLLICFDGRIPEIARSLALQGAEVIVDMANFFTMDQAEMWVPARAYENGVWIVAATKSGVERSIYYPGGSTIVSPDGDVKVRMPYDMHGVATAEINPELANNKSWQFGGDKFVDRRPNSYALLSQPFSSYPLSKILGEEVIPQEMSTKVAALQLHATLEDDSLDKAWQMVTHAAKLGAKLLALPLNFASPIWAMTEPQGKALADKTPELIQYATGICKNYDCAIVLPSIEMTTDNKLIPTAYLISKDGILGTQAQIHLGQHEKDWAEAGTEFKVFETQFGRIGLVVGYDGCFPESTRVLTMLGAEIIVWSSAWEHRHQRELLTVQKAEDNRIYLVCSNRTDSPYPGGSFVVPPNGFPHWDVNLISPVNTRWGAVLPAYASRAFTHQKEMIPNVDMVRNRIINTYGPITSNAS